MTSERAFAMIDGNEAVASVAYRTSEVIAIYPITPASPMGEWSDAWSAAREPNLFGVVPTVVEMQSEGGAAGAVHGALLTGALATTFTSSQGLLLMIPNMYKIAGELAPMVLHVAARSLATHALSIFGDHSDVMAARATGFALLASASVQEAHDFAAIAHAATLESRIPILHFFDGFRTSHEIANVTRLSDEDLRALIPVEKILEHRARSLSPDHPTIKGTAQNPDVFFQARERSNPFYAAMPDIVQQVMDRFGELTGRRYHIFDYHGAPDAERIIVLMGSGAEAVHETVDWLNAHGEKVGVLKVRLFRPFDVFRFIEMLPPTVQSIAVLDRTKEPGSAGEPLYLDVVNAVYEILASGWRAAPALPRIIGGRYGLSSKEFTPAMIKGVFDALETAPAGSHVTVGIRDDVSRTSIPYDPSFSIEPDDVVRAIFYGLGSDGTVSANKNSIKIIGESTDLHAQGYFVYDSKKAGAVTVSHLRFGPRPIRSSYLVSDAHFVACHQPGFLDRYEMMDALRDGGTFLLNTSCPPEEIWSRLPKRVRSRLSAKRARLFVIDATRVARESGMGGRINTIMQVCFFALSGVLPRDEAIARIKDAIAETYGKKGEGVVEKNLRAVDRALENLFEVAVPPDRRMTLVAAPPADVTTLDGAIREIIAGRGEHLPVSALPCDGTFPVATSQWEKRNLALEIPVWDPDACIQCGKCAMVCPHATIRIKAYDPSHLETAPSTFKSMVPMAKEWKELRYSIQVAPEDCTGCAICVDVCPAKSKSDPSRKALFMQPQPPLRDAERVNWDYFLTLPEFDRKSLTPSLIRHQQLQQPLFEFSGACSGCGETPYLKLLTQLFGDRAIIANATGCSSIYGGNLPTTPWAKNGEGRGPAWANSLFEDNAEFGIGFRISLDAQRQFAEALLRRLAPRVGENLAEEILAASQSNEADIHEQRDRIALLKQRLGVRTALTRMHGDDPSPERQLLALADLLVRKSVWIVGGDGWAYDIGFGGLDHVLASGRNVNVLVLDTEVYSNTGGQMSKATPRGAVAKFATGGKPASKKDLGLIAMTYGNVYVASVAMGARDEHTLKAFLEAEAYPGPSLIIAYSHCIAHGIEISTAMHDQKAAVESGQWLLYRYHPEKPSPLTIDSRGLKLPVEQFMKLEKRFSEVLGSADLLQQAQRDIEARWKRYQDLANRQ